MMLNSAHDYRKINPPDIYLAAEMSSQNGNISVSESGTCISVLLVLSSLPGLAQPIIRRKVFLILDKAVCKVDELVIPKLGAIPMSNRL